MNNTKKGLDDENTWIAMIGLVASTLVVFILMLIFIVPVDTDVVLVTDEEVLLVQMEEISSDYRIIKDFQKIKNVKQIPDNLINYIGANFDTAKKYLIKLSFAPNKNLSKGSNYESAYGYAKTSLLMLVKAGIPIENIRIKLVEDYSLQIDFPIIELSTIKNEL